jgi:nucleotide-binding universal stress UspA family protein
MTGPQEDAGWSCLIVGYDRTDSARLAAAWAARQLRPDGKLVILHACRPLHAQPSPLTNAKQRRELARAVIDELLMEDAGPLLEVDVEADISDDDPVTALIEAARHHGAQGIVVGHEQHSRLHRALGTVTIELLSNSPVPVITVPLSAAEVSEQTPTQSGGRSR